VSGATRAAPGRVPSSTYRLQVRTGLTLDGIVERGWLEVLVRLGVSHLYLSPVFAAASGSTHGYDVVDHAHVDPELGGDDAFERLSRAARDRGLGVVVDLVPNHMAADPDGYRRWWDVLRNGPSSRWADLFDIDWDVPEARLAGRLLLPVLGDHCGREIEAGRFGVRVRDDGEPVISHPSIDVPLELASIAPVLAEVPGVEDVGRRAAELPAFGAPRVGDRALRTEAEAALRGELHALLSTAEGRDPFLGVMEAVVSDPGRLDALLESQPYRLARWRAGLEDLGYRRFFDVTSLVALRTDRREVFDLTHTAVRRWVEADLVDGVRVDHVDGLADPAGYLTWLRELVGDRWIVVEKILEAGEDIPAGWPIDGTTGYEVAELVDRLDLADAGRAPLERLAEDGGAETDVEQVERESMSLVLDELLGADLNRLVDLGVHLCEGRRRLRDTTRRELREILVAALGRFGRYRTYVVGSATTSDEDRTFVTGVMDRVVAEEPHLDRDVVDFVHRLLVGEAGDGAAEREFAVRFQQLSGPTRAKGCEDTAWYRLVAMIARCEVGADPDAWGLSLEGFHDAMSARQDRWPSAMSSLTTHDSKRSGDVRAALEVLTQWADDLVELVEGWWAARGRGPAPHLDTYAVQTLFGCVGLLGSDDGPERLRTHLTKAMREAKEHTSWLDPDEAFESAVVDRVVSFTMDAAMSARMARLRSAADPVTRTAILAHTLVALTAPGVPDLYQGSETWHFRLVDPDNRAPVDPRAAAERLDQLDAAGGAVPPDHGSAKLAVVTAALGLRRRRSGDFAASSTYRPLWAVGPRADHAVAYGRGGGVVVVVPRLGRRISDGWAGTRLALPDGSWRDLLGGETWSGDVALDELLGSWPVALLEVAT
jgi:(1->4)-alpha-D-glucan 1-alpha-D-glucosylmutase